MPAETLTVSRATNGRVLVTYFCYSKASTRGPEDIHVVDRIMNVWKIRIRLFKSPCFLGLLLSSSFKRAEAVGKYKVTLPDVLASLFILIHTESFEHTQYILIDSVCRFVHSKKEHSFEVVGDSRYRLFVTNSSLKIKAIVNGNITAREDNQPVE